MCVRRSSEHSGVISHKIAMTLVRGRFAKTNRNRRTVCPVCRAAIRLKKIDTTKHVEPKAEGLRTRGRLPPPPPKQKKVSLALTFLHSGQNGGACDRRSGFDTAPGGWCRSLLPRGDCCLKHEDAGRIFRPRPPISQWHTALESAGSSAALSATHEFPMPHESRASLIRHATCQAIAPSRRRERERRQAHAVSSRTHRQSH